MKHQKHIYFFVIGFALLINSSCKKYPDGPLLNLYSKFSRIEGNWDVESFTVNNYDSTSSLKMKPFYGRYSFAKEHDELIVLYSAMYNSIYNKKGTWEFRNQKKNLYIDIVDNSGVLPYSMGPYGANNITWEIRRLKTTQLWLKTIYNGDEYYLKLKHIQ